MIHIGLILSPIQLLIVIVTEVPVSWRAVCVCLLHPTPITLSPTCYGNATS